jgi:hypothetical protein
VPSRISSGGACWAGSKHINRLLCHLAAASCNFAKDAAEVSAAFADIVGCEAELIDPLQDVKGDKVAIPVF